MKIPKILLVVCCLSLLGCEPLDFGPQKTISDFYTDFEKGCKGEYFINKLNEFDAKSACDCMMKEVKNRWKSLGELQDALSKEDRIPRGYTDFMRGASRITYKTCKS
ncbi:MAG: hypothetical protein RI918_1331 [Pseudomonadota bacterium]|jgi:hypothetical protein